MNLSSKFFLLTEGMGNFNHVFCMVITFIQTFGSIPFLNHFSCMIKSLISTLPEKKKKKYSDQLVNFGIVLISHSWRRYWSSHNFLPLFV